MTNIEEYVFSDVEICGVMGTTNDEIAIDTGNKLIYISEQDVIAMAEHFGIVEKSQLDHGLIHKNKTL